MNRNKNLIQKLSLIIVLVMSMLPMQACGDVGNISAGEVVGSVNEKTANYDLGSFQIKGLEGTIEGHTISFAESELTQFFHIVEKASVGGNDEYDADDWGFGFSIYKKDKIHINIALNVYENFKANQVYEYTLEDFGNVTLSYYFNDGSASNASIKTISVVFSKVPSSAGNLVEGELELVTHQGGIIIVSFSAKAVSQESSLY